MQIMRTQKFLTTKPIRVVATALGLSIALSPAPFYIAVARAQNADAPAVGAARTLSLRQKWTAGQQLSYGVSLSGTMSAQASPHSKSFLAGVPMDIEVRMEGDTTLDTLAVDELGTGTVAMRVERLRLRAETFGQKGEFSVSNGKAQMTLNGQRLGGNRPLDAKAFSEPEWALQISDRGRLKGAVPIKTSTPKTPPNAQANPGNDKRPQGLPFDPAAFAQSMFLRVIPNLWPQTEVKTGEKWSAEVLWPGDELARIAAAKSGLPASETKEPPLSLGKIDFTLMGEEEVAGRKAVRIAVDGGFTVDETKAKAMQGAIGQLSDPKEANKEAVPNSKAADAKTARDRQWKSNLERAEQKVSGNVWFDAQAGHIVRAELQLSTQASARDVAVKENARPNSAAPKAPKVVDADSWLDFAGTLQFQLKDVQQKNIVAQPATVTPDGNA